MKYTVLELTQNILSALNSDEVNSISDTVESRQVAEIIRTSYYNMLGRYDLPEHNQIFQLTPSTDTTKPTLMYRPEGINRIEWLKYWDANPHDNSGNLQFDQFGAYSKHDVNVDLQNNSGIFSTSSTSSNTIGLGSKTFTIAARQPIAPFSPVTAFNGINSMSGTVASYVGTTLIINVTSITGSGTFSVWTIQGIGSLLSPPGYLDVKLVPIQHFLDMTNSFDLTEPNVQQMTISINFFGSDYNENLGLDTVRFKYKNDRQPRYWTIVSNFYILFDSYDAQLENTLQASNTLAFGWVIPEFQMADGFIPNLDDQQFPLLLNEAKSLAFLELKQMPHPKAEKEVMRQLTSLQKFKFTAHRPTPFEELADFGRRPGTGGYALYRNVRGG